MVDQGPRGRTVAVTILLGALVSFLGLLVAFAVVAVVAVTATDTALSGGFYWGSAVAGVLVLAGSGLIAGRMAVPRLRRAGLVGGVLPYAVAAAGPMLVALVWFSRPAVGGPVFGVLVPALAAGGGAAIGVRLRN
jgi:hypothetical protein